MVQLPITTDLNQYQKLRPVNFYKEKGLLSTTLDIPQPNEVSTGGAREAPAENHKGGSTEDDSTGFPGIQLLSLPDLAR